MITPYDKEYIANREIKRGNATIHSDFVELAAWFGQMYGVKPLNIIYDTIDPGKRPRFEICFEFTAEHENFSRKKEPEIIRKFSELLAKTPNPAYSTEKMFVIFTDFEPVAKIETNENIPEEKIIALNESIGNPDLWKISRSFSRVTFFLYTDKQTREYEKSPTREEWTDRYFALLKQYDEFDYLKRDTFSIFVDSKENFDNNYEGSWFYYYR